MLCVLTACYGANPVDAPEVESEEAGEGRVIATGVDDLGHLYRDHKGKRLWPRSATNFKAPTINLQIDTAEEATEESEGAIVLLKEGYEEDNENKEGVPIWDCYKSDRIVPSDEEVRHATLNLDGTPGATGKWKLSFPHNVLVWQRQSSGGYSKITSGQEYEATFPHTIDLLLEGLTVSPNETPAAMVAEMSYAGTTVTDRVAITVTQLEMTSQLISGGEWQDDGSNGPPPEMSQPAGAARLNAPGAPGGLAATGNNLATISNFPPLMSYNIYSNRTLSILIPRRARGRDVKWKVTDTGRVRSVAAGSSYSTELVIPSNAIGQSSVIFKTQMPGSIQVKVWYKSAAGQWVLIGSKKTYAVFIKRLAETDHQANRVPNNKWNTGTNYTNQKPAIEQRVPLANTLFVSQEPENNNVDLLLETNLPRGKAPYWWMLKGTVAATDGGSSREHAPRERLVRDAKGVARVRFEPATSFANREYLSGVYQLHIQTDSDGNGQPDFLIVPFTTPEPRLRDRTATFDVNFVSLNQVGFSRGLLQRTALGLPLLDLQFTGAVLHRFVDPGSPFGTTGPYSISRAAPASLSADNTSLTHIAGAHFNASTRRSTVSKYFWRGGLPSENGPEQKILISKGFRDAIVSVLKWKPKGSTEMPRIRKIRAFFQRNQETAHTFWWNVTEPVDWGKYRSNRPVDGDIFFAIGNASYIGDIGVTVVRSGNTLSVLRVTTNGYVEDMTDYDFFGAGFSSRGVSVPVSQRGAEVQIGWETPQRPGGRVYFNRTVLNNETLGVGSDTVDTLSRVLSRINLTPSR